MRYKSLYSTVYQESRNNADQYMAKTLSSPYAKKRKHFIISENIYHVPWKMDRNDGNGKQTNGD